MNEPRSLIIGAPGFIGKHLYARLGREATNSISDDRDSVKFSER